MYTMAFHGGFMEKTTQIQSCSDVGSQESDIVKWGSTLWAGPEDDHQVSSMAVSMLKSPLREKRPGNGKFRMAIKTNEHLNPLISYYIYISIYFIGFPINKT